jgi:superfamily II DNA or RNA helicase
VAEQFRAAGYLSEAVSGKDKDNERDRKLAGLADKTVQVLTTCDLISEGTDLPEVVCGICLRPTASEGLHIQQIGRVLRAMHADGYPIETAAQRLLAIKNGPKPFAIILDHVGNYMRHGRPKDDRAWSLDGAVKNSKKLLEKKIPKTKTVQCPACYYIHEPEPICPNTFPTICGHVYETKTREVKKQDGELVEITDEMARSLKKEKKLEISRARSLEDFQAIAAARGHKPYWAIQMWEWKKHKINIQQPLLPNNDSVVYYGQLSNASNEYLI